MFCTEDQWRQLLVLSKCLDQLGLLGNIRNFRTCRGKKKPNHLNECGSPNVQLYEHWISTLSQRGNIAQIQFASMSISTFTSYCKRPQLHLFVFSLITYCWNSLKLPFPLSPTILRSFRVLNRLPVTPRVHLALHADHFLSVQIKKVHTSRPPQLLTQLIWWQLL